jgi:hypothetical protein
LLSQKDAFAAATGAALFGSKSAPGIRMKAIFARTEADATPWRALRNWAGITMPSCKVACFSKPSKAPPMAPVADASFSSKASVMAVGVTECCYPRLWFAVAAVTATLGKDSWQKTISVQDHYFDQNNKRHL